MRYLTIIPAILLMFGHFFFFSADAAYCKTHLSAFIENEEAIRQNNGSVRILGIQNFGVGGYLFDRDALYRSDDGAAFRRVELSTGVGLSIAGIDFQDMEKGTVLLTGRDIVVIAETIDGGKTWQRRPIRLEISDDTNLSQAKLSINGSTISIEFRLETSSNFNGRVKYLSRDGINFEKGERSVDIRRSDEPEQLRSGDWQILTNGDCQDLKDGCLQYDVLLDGSGNDITPNEIISSREAARSSSRRQFSSIAPGGSVRISLNRGFDKCTAGTVSQMQSWWDNSPLYDSNIYISGRNRGCSQPQLTSTWVNQVSAMGWGLIPTVVGYQSPCTSSTTSAKFSYDTTTAETQGRGEADIAAADAAALGLTAGSVLYYDMERYDPPSPDTLGCRAASIAFLKGWTDRVKELGYKSGTYGSPKNAQEDWLTLPVASRMDAIWMARWDNVPSVWTYVSFSTFPTTEWANHQRIKQWQAPHNETWGGITFNIDGNNADGPVAGAAIAKNKIADFDGDGRSDISVYRPDTGSWYVCRSATSSFWAVGFGLATDIITPGDFDGDGKTDIAIFRPSTGEWHILAKGLNYYSLSFGVNGDIPVAADYNGDGKTDIAVFRPSNSTWYIANSDSQGTYTFVQFGQAGDKPVPADYDGDGKSDIAIYRPNGLSSADWYVYRSSNGNVTGLGFGLATDRPVQGDYDGDGKADPAVYRNGVWYWLGSTAGFNAVNFGLSDDIVSPGDFDGDAKTDPTVFRPSTGVWYSLQSANGFMAAQWGTNGDRPIENGYLPQ